MAAMVRILEYIFIDVMASWGLVTRQFASLGGTAGGSRTVSSGTGSGVQKARQRAALCPSKIYQAAHPGLKR